MSLTYVGYAPLRAGRIHLYCPRCKRKLSNMPRSEYVPSGAVLASVRCDRCSVGDKESYTIYRDSSGRELCGYCGRWSCERAGGRTNCDERLVKALAATR